MKTKYILITSILLVIFLVGCQQQQKIYEQPEKETLIISLEKAQEISGVKEKYEIYSTGKYIVTLANKNKQETKKENILSEADLNYLKSLVSSKPFSTIPNYMEGSGENCPLIILKTSLNNNERILRAESCANTPEAFNLVQSDIEKLK